MTKREELLFSFAISFLAALLAIAMYMQNQPKPQIQCCPQYQPPQMMQPGYPPFPPSGVQDPALGQPGMMPSQPGMATPSGRMHHRRHVVHPVPESRK